MEKLKTKSSTLSQGNNGVALLLLTNLENTMYKPKTIHYLFSYEYLADKYDRERPTGMCPDEWDMKILDCTPAQYFKWVSVEVVL